MEAVRVRITINGDEYVRTVYVHDTAAVRQG